MSPGSAGIKVKCVLSLGLLCPAAASAQKLLDVAQLGPAAVYLDAQTRPETLPCEVQPVKPTLTFGFRFQAGYTFRVPLKQISRSDSAWTVITRITPEHGNRRPTYLMDSVKLPEIRSRRTKAEWSGGYWLGQGAYSVAWVLLDSRGRVCRETWRIHASQSLGGKLDLAMPPDTVADLTVRSLSQPDPRARTGTPMRITVLLDAAPLQPAREGPVDLRSSDRLLLLSALSGLLERLPASSIRLVVFSLEQQKELFRQDDFTLQEMDHVEHALSTLNVNAVDYRVLQNPTGYLALLTGIIEGEIRSTPPSAAVIFLGPRTRYDESAPREALAKLNGSEPHLFYLQCMPAPQLVKAAIPDYQYADTYQLKSQYSSDSISAMTKSLNGQVLTVYSPEQFAAAVERIRQQAPPGH